MKKTCCLGLWLQTTFLMLCWGQEYIADVISSPEVIYNWSAQHCSDGLQPYNWDVPDAPVRVYRTYDTDTSYFISSVNLGSRVNYINTSDIDRYPIIHTCQVYYNSTNNFNVSMFSDREWITATYIIPNTTVLYGLIHMEYHGWSDSSNPCSDPFPACWYNVITLIKSNDNGLTWYYPFQPPNHLVAALPYKYFYNQPPFGWRSPSNIFYNQKDGYFYATVTTFPYGNQSSGTTIMRTNNIEIPNSWKCWNGTSFSVNISTNPYTTPNINPNDYVCNIITNSTYPTILYSTYFDKYMLVGTTNGYDTAGYGFALSDDLVHWDGWYIIRKGYPWNATYNEIYPSFIDLNSTDFNYNTVGEFGYLYYIVSQGQYGNTLERSIYRQKIQFSKNNTH